MARRFLNVVSEDDFIFFRLFALVVLGKPGFPYLGVGRGAVSAVFTVTVLFHPFPLWQLLFIWLCVWIRLWVLLAPPPSALGFVC